jgi:hypothetical protein
MSGHGLRFYQETERTPESSALPILSGSLGNGLDVMSRRYLYTEQEAVLSAG